jgi:hypothetical protein
LSKKLTWTVAIPAALVALAVIALFALDVAKGGATKHDGYLGEAKGEKYPYIAPTPTPFGGAPTVRPRPTIPGGGGTVSGDPEERDEKRRSDLLVLVGVAEDFKAENGGLPSTNGNVQTLCNYQDLDQGCALSEVLSPLPFDPLRDPVRNGYWYSSDGTTAKFYASLEGEIPDDQQCETQDAELMKKAYLICVEAR